MGSWKHHAHGLAAQVAQACALACTAVRIEVDLPARYFQFFGQQAHDRGRHHRFTRARLAHHAQRFAGFDGQGHTVDRKSAVCTFRQGYAQFVDTQNRRRGVHSVRCGLAFGKLRVKHIAQAIAQQVNGQHRGHEEHGREQHVAGKLAELHAPLSHDVAPRRNVCRQAQAQKAEHRFGQHRSRGYKSALHNQRAPWRWAKYAATKSHV